MAPELALMLAQAPTQELEPELERVMEMEETVTMYSDYLLLPEGKNRKGTTLTLE
jgi:hypothetical protein